ncbi:MAG: pyridoxal-phosphate dependent enzyme [Gemmatimonadaceae bacterium]|jgi:threonine dehydratase|nr:pyridoxal-phosphate dependent enzyme [Gemmatimonadaceae bacterium]
MVWTLDPSLVRDAAARLAPLAGRTPLRRSAALSAHAGAEVWLKLETEQTGGSFKIRGAINVVATLSPAERDAGIVASSAGNHGTGLALAARAAGVAVTLFVPHDAPAVKQAKMRAAGAQLDTSGRDYDDAERLAMAHAAATGRRFVSPCTGTMLVAGQGTVGLEIAEQCPAVRTVVVCVGGGGLVGGIGGWFRATSPGVRIVGAQSDQTTAMAASLAAGRRVDVAVPPTLADGLAGQIDDDGFAMGRAVLDDMALVTEAELAAAIAWLWHEEGIRAEGAGAVAVAALLAGRVPHASGPVVATVSGGNIDPERHARVVAAASAAGTASRATRYE